MRPKGTIYRKGFKKAGEFRVSLTKFEKKIFKKIRFASAIIASFSITSLIYFYGPSLILDLGVLQARVNHPIDVETETNNFSLVDSENKKEDEELTVENFDINIPAINASSNVIYNVDPFEKSEYTQALQEGVAHASTSVLPGQGGRVYLFAHSTNSPLNFSQFNAIFYQLRLLKTGDEIITNLNGEEYGYKVVDKQVVAADDIHWLTEKSNSEQLVLQTCDPPGTNLRRLLVIAERI